MSSPDDFSLLQSNGVHKQHTAELTVQLEVVKVQMEAYSQVCRGELASLQHAMNELKGRTEVLEVRTQAISDQYGEIPGSKRRDDSLCPLPQVQTLVAETLASVCADWRAELDDKLANNCESKVELGRTLVKEFERSIVAKHAERLAGVELKLRTLGVELQKLQQAATVDSQTMQPKNEERSAGYPESNDVILHSVSSSPQAGRTFAVLEDDVESLRFELRRFMSVDMNQILSSVQRLQSQSDDMMDLIERNKVSLELSCKEKLAEFKDSMTREVWAMIRKAQGTDQVTFANEIQRRVQDIISKVDVNSVPGNTLDRQPWQSLLSSDTVTLADGDEGLAELQTQARLSSVPSTGVGTSQSLVSELSGPVRVDADESSQLAEDLRSSLLSYFRTEFQDHVTHVLQGLQSQSQSITVPSGIQSGAPSPMMSFTSAPWPQHNVSGVASGSLTMQSPVVSGSMKVAVAPDGIATGTTRTASPTRAVGIGLTQPGVTQQGASLAAPPPESVAPGTTRTASPTRNINLSVTQQSLHSASVPAATQVYATQTPSPSLVMRQTSYTSSTPRSLPPTVVKRAVYPSSPRNSFKQV